MITRLIYIALAGLFLLPQAMQGQEVPYVVVQDERWTHDFRFDFLQLERSVGSNSVYSFHAGVFDFGFLHPFIPLHRKNVWKYINLGLYAKLSNQPTFGLDGISPVLYAIRPGLRVPIRSWQLPFTHHLHTTLSVDSQFYLLPVGRSENYQIGDLTTPFPVQQPDMVSTFGVELLTTLTPYLHLTLSTGLRYQSGTWAHVESGGYTEIDRFDGFYIGAGIATGWISSLRKKRPRATRPSPGLDLGSHRLVSGYQYALDSDTLYTLPDGAVQFPPELHTTALFADPNRNGRLDGGEKGTLIVTIENKGRGVARDLYVQVVPHHAPTLQQRLRYEAVHTIDLLPPGRKHTLHIDLRAAADLPPAALTFAIHTRERHLGIDSPPLRLPIGLHAAPPRFAFTEVSIDDGQGKAMDGNGNGVIEVGELVEVSLWLENHGEGTARGVRAHVTTSSPQVILSGMPSVFTLGDLGQGGWRKLSFSLLVNSRYTGETQLPITIRLAEDSGDHGLTHTPDIVLERPQMVMAIPHQRGFSDRPGVAVVIGNRHYDHYPNDPVTFAENDYEAMHTLASRQLGFDDVLGGTNTGLADLRTLFGIPDNPAGVLYATLRQGESVFVYMTGHGHSRTQPDGPARSFIVPADGNISTLEASTYGLDVLYENLAYLIEHKKPEKLVVVLDMCFSGYLAQTVSGLGWEHDNPLVDLRDLSETHGVQFGAVFATRAEETAKWHLSEEHGLLTYFMAQALRNAPTREGWRADRNGDGLLTLGELREFLLDDNYGVPYYARQTQIIGDYADPGQTPIVLGDDNLVLIRYE